MSSVRPSPFPPAAARRRWLLPTGLAAVVILVLAASGAWTDVLYLVPVLLLAVTLAFGRYPGEHALAAFVREARRPHAAPYVATGRRRAATLLPRGGRLVAARLAGRAPPTLLASA